MNLEQRIRVKILWLAKWIPEEIAEFENLQLNEVQDLINIFERR